MTNRGTVTLMGSGELTDSMARVHRSLLARGANPSAVFLDTPAGFELNADEISARAVEYFKQHFDVELAIASFKTKSRATPLEVQAALHLLRRANYIFAGPGSPTYAIRHWRGTAIWDTLVTRLVEGAQLTLASAGAIAVGCCALPVYEIYKAGHEIDWVDGLDLFGMFRLKLAIMPHWNNAEGGTYDTRFCWMGEPRLKILEDKLPFDVAIVGIDEHTACTFEPGEQRCVVTGVGGVTVRHQGGETFYPSGSTFPFTQLHANLPPEETGEAAPNIVTLPDPQLATAQVYLSQLARALETAHAPDEQRELIDHAHDTMHELAQEWRAEDKLQGDDLAPLIEWLVELRSKLRTRKQFAFADEIRDQLAARGIVIEDTPNGTTWKSTKPSPPGSPGSKSQTPEISDPQSLGSPERSGGDETNGTEGTERRGGSGVG